MNTAFRESFESDLASIRDAALLRRIRKIIEQVEAAGIFQQIPNLKRLEATGKYYRIRVGDYHRFCVRARHCDLCSLSQSQGNLSLLSVNARRMTRNRSTQSSLLKRCSRIKNSAMKAAFLSATILLLIALFSGCATAGGASSGSNVNVNGSVSTSVETSF